MDMFIFWHYVPGYMVDQAPIAAAMETLDFCYYCYEDYPYGEFGDLKFNSLKDCFYCVKCGRFYSFYERGYVYYKINSIKQLDDLLIDVKVDVDSIGIENYYIYNDQHEFVYARMKKFSIKWFRFLFLLRKKRGTFYIEKRWST